MKLYSILSASIFSLSVFCDVACADDVSDLLSRSEDSGVKAANEASGLIDGFRKYAALQSGLGSSASKHKPFYSSQKNPKQKPLKDIPLPHNGKKGCKDNASPGSGKCPSSLFEGMEEKQPLGPHSNTQLLIFVSQSVPQNSIKELWNQAQRAGGKLVFRGLVGGAFKKTQSYIEELGIVADIDPTKFEEFEIIQVPAFVLSKGDKHDKMVGNVSLVGFLEQSSTSGELRAEATELYKKLQGEQP